MSANNLVRFPGVYRGPPRAPPRAPPDSMERSRALLAIRDALRLLVHHTNPDAMAFACIEEAIEYVAGGDFKSARGVLENTPSSRGWR